jgi:hypothetical protein
MQEAVTLLTDKQQLDVVKVGVNTAFGNLG